MTGKRNTLLIVIALGSLWAVPAQAASPAPGQEPLRDAANAMYNAEYQKAQVILRGWLQLHPSDFRAWNYLAEAILDEEMLKESLFIGSAYLTGGEVYHQRRQPLPKEFEENFHATLEKANTLENERLKGNPSDQEALYWLGVTYSTRTEYEFALLRSYYSALKDGKLAWKANKRLLRLNPDYTDAYLVIGVADYAVSLLPWYVKVVTSIAGIHGNRKRGIAELQRAAEDGHYSREDARIVLVEAYEREKNYPAALTLLLQIERQFPENFLAPLEVARIYKAEDNWRAAARVYDDTVARFVRPANDPSQVPSAMILFRAAEAHEHLGELKEALSLDEEAANLPDKSLPGYRAELAAGNLDRRLNRMPEARRAYKHVAEALPDTDLGRAAKQALSEMR